MEKAKVYFTKNISKESLVRIYEKLGVELKGNVAVKLHSGEDGNQNYLRPEFVQDIIEHVGGTVVECNTAYEGARNTTEKHEKLMESHGWSKYFKVDILDSEADEVLENPNGAVIQKNYVGAKMKNYDSMLVLSHFKGHPMGGFGGAIKNLSIGLASSKGKSYIHTSGMEEASFDDLMNADHDSFLKSMADSAKTITDFYKDNIVYINAMVNLSVDCDCCGVAADPCMADIGILASLDPVAIDQACIDLVYNSTDEGRDTMVERIESRNGLLTIESAEKQGVGIRSYELVEID
ncbi:MAG: DUF362 domain-containing protein [Bacilli bacterium]|nr:DUF362 domain-containing protein [Bacilli bacterium]